MQSSMHHAGTLPNLTTLRERLRGRRAGCTPALPCPADANRQGLGLGPAEVARDGRGEPEGMRRFRFALDTPLPGGGDWLTAMK